MGQKPPKVIYGRQVPEAVSRNSFRDMMRRKLPRFSLVCAGVLSLGASVPQEDKSTYVNPDVTAAASDTRVNAEERHIEAANPHTELITFEFTDISSVSPHAMEPREDGRGLRPYYLMQKRGNIYEAILQEYNAAGEFNIKTRQNARSSVYLGEERDDLETNNQRAAYESSNNVAEGLLSDTLGVARLVRFDAPGAQGTRAVCTVIVTSEKYDSDMFVQRFARIDNLVSNKVHDVAHFNQAIANHEYAHCVYNPIGEDTWQKESRADLYAVARHIQINGDDGFAQTWRDLRNMNVVSIGDSGHDTIPMLDRAIPVLLEAHKRGDLQGLDSAQLNEFTLNAVAQANDQTRDEMWEEVGQEVLARQEAMKDMRGSTVKIAGVIQLDREAAREKNLSSLERGAVNSLIDSHNQSVYRQFDMRCLVAVRHNGVENEVFARYRENIEGYIASQESPEKAYDNVGYRAWKIRSEERRLISRLGEETTRYIMANDRDETGLTANEKLEIINEYRAELAEEIEISPSRSQEQITIS